MAWLTSRRTRRGQVRYSVCYRDSAGVHRSVATRTGDKRLALREKARVEATLEGRLVPRPSLPAKPLDLLDAFVADLLAQRSEDTAKSYRAYLSPMAREWSRVPLVEWSRAMAAEYLRRKRGSTWGTQSARLWVAACRKWIAWGADVGAAIPDFLGPLRAGKQDKKLPRSLDAAQMRALLAASRDTAYELPVALAACAGMRRKEIVGARVEDVDLAGRRLVVRGTKSHAERAVPIAPLLEAVLRRQMPTAATGALVDFGVKRMTSTYAPLATLCRQAGVPEVTWHALRHGYAQTMLAAGATLRDVQDLLGHANLATTGIYLKASVKGMAAAADRAFGA